MCNCKLWIKLSTEQRLAIKIIMCNEEIISIFCAKLWVWTNRKLAKNCAIDKSVGGHYNFPLRGGKSPIYGIYSIILEQ